MAHSVLPIITVTGVDEGNAARRFFISICISEVIDVTSRRAFQV